MAGSKVLVGHDPCFAMETLKVKVLFWGLFVVLYWLPGDAELKFGASF